MPLDGVRGVMGGDLGLLTDEVVAGKERLTQARRAAARVASAVADRWDARRVESEINDAYLRLQFSLVSGDAERVQVERGRIASLAQAWAAPVPVPRAHAAGRAAPVA